MLTGGIGADKLYIGQFMGGQHSQMAHVNAMRHSTQENQKIQWEQAKTRAKRPTDKNMPDGMGELTIGDGVEEYKKLRDVERRLDAVMMRKRLELAEKKQQTSKKTQTLRIWISNTAENQPWQGKDLDENAFDFSTGVEATYKVSINGRVISNPEEDVLDSDDEDSKETADGRNSPAGDVMDHDGKEKAEGKTDKIEKSTKARQKLAHFFKSITVEYDRSRSLQPDGNNLIEWKKDRQVPPNMPNPPVNVDFDCLEFERKGDENINVTINLYRDETPERYLINKDLADIIDCEEATRETVVNAIWEYARAMDLQPDEEKRMIHCDDRLRAVSFYHLIYSRLLTKSQVFKVESLAIPRLQEAIIPHLAPLPPVKLPYTIRVDPEYHNNPTPTIYDILVPAPDPLQTKIQSLTARPEYRETLKEIAALDEQLALIVQSLNQSKARHSFFSSLAIDPSRFIRKWTSSQKKDLEMILGDSRIGTSGGEWMGDEYRRGGSEGVWGTENVRESVGLMVSKPAAPR